MPLLLPLSPYLHHLSSPLVEEQRAVGPSQCLKKRLQAGVRGANESFFFFFFFLGFSKMQSSPSLLTVRRGTKFEAETMFET